MVANSEYLLPIFRESCMSNISEKRVTYINVRSGFELSDP